MWRWTNKTIASQKDTCKKRNNKKKTDQGRIQFLVGDGLNIPVSFC